MTTPPPPNVANAPGLPRIDRQVSPHPDALARMRAALSADGLPGPVRALALHDTSDPAVALLDGWALVADVVSFYSERIAEEGYLRTAIERASLRELARTLGHELRPGLAARTDLVFVVEDAPGAPAEALVPRGTPVQTVPGAGMLPQVFETTTELAARAEWNTIPGARTGVRQPLASAAAGVWLFGTMHGVRVDDLLLVGDDQTFPRGVHGVTAVEEEPGGLTGWTRVRLDGIEAGDIPDKHDGPVLRLEATAGRCPLFGWNGPDRRLLRPEPPWTDEDPIMGHGFLELDGEHPEVRIGTWLLLVDGAGSTGGGTSAEAQPPAQALVRATSVRLSGRSDFGVAGPVTLVTLGPGAIPDIARFRRRSTVVHIFGRTLPADTAPDTTPVSGDKVVLSAVEQVLPRGRVVAVTGRSPDGAAQTETRRVALARLGPAAGAMTVELDQPLRGSYDRQTVQVHGNVVEATHGETVEQVLGSGDGRAASVSFPLRRGPLTHLPTDAPTGARSTLEVRVDGVVWTEVESLADAGGDDRVVAVREGEDGLATVLFGDGVHGARVPSGQENVTATYRVGMGADGEAAVGQVSLLTRRPFGIRSVSNLLPTTDSAPRETADEARDTAPTRVRTLDRIVSLADFEDVARNLAGVGAAAVSAVWNGHSNVVVVTVRGIVVPLVTHERLAQLRARLDAMRDPAAPLEVKTAVERKFGVRVTLLIDPAHRSADVAEAARARLTARFGRGRWGIARPVTAAQLLVVVRAVPGVVAVAAMPELTTEGEPPSLRVEAAPARWDLEHGEIIAAELATLDPGNLTIDALRSTGTGP